MEDFRDALTTSPGSARVISNSLKEYGEGSMWEGIRELVLEAYGEGRKKGCAKAYRVGFHKGFIEGSIVSVSVLVFVGSIFREIEQYYKDAKRKEVMEDEQDASNVYCL